MSEIKSVAVIGAGVMGAAIAAHVANAGIKVKLLDIVKPGSADRNAIAKGAIERFKKAQPNPLMSSAAARLITPGNTEDNFDSLAECDWIVEAVIERLDIKQALYARLAQVRKPGSVLSSNTSTIPLAELTAGMDEGLKPDFMITHFFNPPRYMRLLELVTSTANAPDSVRKLQQFCDVTLGKSVIICNDTPGFIANRIGTYWIQSAMSLALDLGLEVEEADAIMGKPMGFPSTGVFGLMDLVGIDLGPHVNASLARFLPPTDPFHSMNRDVSFIEKLIAEGYTGKKGKGGFYRSQGRGADRVKETLSLAAAAAGRLEWRPSIRPKIAEVADAKKDLKKLVGAKSKPGQYAWGVLGRVLAYAASLLGEIAPDVASIDEAMRLGYTWKYGPFELIDQLGASYVASKLAELSIPVPPVLAKIGDGKFYKTEGRSLLQFGVDGTYRPVVRPAGVLLLEDVKRGAKPVLGNKSASVWDIGDGVLCVEFHSIMNALDGDILSLLEKTIALVQKSYRAMVIYSEDLRAGPGKENFSVGANLGFAMFAANLRMWGKIEGTIKEGQRVYQLMRTAPIPIVAAPAGRALGGGCEILLHCAAVQAYAETYIGLVEAGVGLIPGWGGCTQMLTRWQADPKMPRGPMPAVAKVFEMVSTAKVSMSAAEAQELKFLRPADGITMNRTRVLADAKARALAMVPGYAPPPDPAPLQLPGATGRTGLAMAVDEFRKKGIATPHDVTVATHLARVLTGGDIDIIDPVPQSAIMDLEREAFMALFRTKETQARIKHIIDTGKPLRN
ncbi:MAG TPA: 3-hydroxyacyl-CoA dehydrogenase NAD-binding domain-containing protein [Acidiphilium sp.]|nr:MAG: 3-hydroxyacyl-CoA dehydrogenase [Acidiphilium sp. 21-60-14]OYV91149.1 MAG: 3-hydroxyacyl-CoA dehydrogenase [Acidiphilium sp. 37-60-79]HQT87025.1 3-hydroxyacyl-CoA dehydrogenase NAD-binding domain-containing protein [Acidiphilium sp.]HQU22928.1 3-hydroxyacyl-CoA dehydrogenase NAD-binding domain-containing protein [Acidiphilium sp.]